MNNNQNIENRDAKSLVESDVKQSMQENTQETYDDQLIDQKEEQALSNNYNVKLIRASSKVSVQLNDVWYAFEFSETREVTDDSRIEEIRNDLWNTVNNEVDNQVQYTIDSILGKVQSQVPQQQVVQQQQNNIPQEYDY